MAMEPGARRRRDETYERMRADELLVLEEIRSSEQERKNAISELRVRNAIVQKEVFERIASKVIFSVEYLKIEDQRLLRTPPQFLSREELARQIELKNLIEEFGDCRNISPEERRRIPDRRLFRVIYDDMVLCADIEDSFRHSLVNFDDGFVSVVIWILGESFVLPLDETQANLFIEAAGDLLGDAMYDRPMMRPQRIRDIDAFIGRKKQELRDIRSRLVSHYIVTGERED